MRVTVTLLLCACMIEPAQAKPNILLIIADDMGVDASRCYQVGDQQAVMVNLERLCSEGQAKQEASGSQDCRPGPASFFKRA